MIHWVDSFVVIAMHELALLEGGGAEGLRDLGLLESALARPRQLLSYIRPKPTIPVLGAAYAWSLIRNHPFTTETSERRSSLPTHSVHVTVTGSKRRKVSRRQFYWLLLPARSKSQD